MGYNRQDFSSGAVFTAAQADQIEENIASHNHGVSSVSFVSVVGGLRTLIYGRVQTASPGSIVSGSFYAITRNNTGNITVSFSKVFAETPAFAVSAAEPTSGARRMANYFTVNVSQGNVRVWSASGTAVEAEFGFVVTGAGSG